MNTIIIALIIFIVIVALLEVLLIVNRIRTKQKFSNQSPNNKNRLAGKLQAKKHSDKTTKRNVFKVSDELINELVEDELSQKVILSSEPNIVDLTEDDLNVTPIVIEAEHVCLDFYKEVNEYTSIKELVIKSIKGQREKGVYRALDDISFSVRKGEVLGVIGTNGAGKSTLLKIIAGALYPTSGRMNVDKSKVQILTLGTGFDMEMTGRENVYLNGSIIGYDKQFLDEHYDQIVEFAELQDFMDERVKNYSSGMVSRLGFAIATAGNAAEILILDEVLSVGDRIFRKKSLKRVKEMIHGGSTVIMVSHSTATIRENCDRALWIEKGHFIDIGSAKEVCSRYDKYNGNFEELLSTSKQRRIS